MFCILQIWLLNFLDFDSRSHVPVVNAQSTTSFIRVM